MGEHGRGTIVPLANGRYRIAVTMADGRRVWRRARTERQAERVRDDLVRMRDLDLDPTRQTLEDYLRSWIRRQSRRVRPRTVDGYEKIIENRLIPDLGHVKLASLSRRKVQAWVDSIDREPRTVRNYHAVLRKALASATGDLIPINPALGVEMPTAQRFKGKPLTIEEARRLLDATKGDRLHPYWRLAIVTGLREGEILGLPRDALDGSILTMTVQLVRLRGQWVLTPPKPGRHLNQIALDAETVRIVREHLARMASERQPSWRYFGLMFVTEEGEPYHEAQIRREFHAACDAAGIARRRPHDLRGTSATILRQLGVSEDTRQARLGHSTTDMARHYGQASEAQDREAVELLAEAIG